MATIALLSVKGLGTALEEDCMEQSCPRDAHQNNVTTGSESCAGAVVGLNS
jgi:hypothetical protein